jgi:hypothetical protein
MKKVLSLGAVLGAASVAYGQIAVVSSDITTDTVWGDDETQVVLDGTIFVKGDATLTVLPGVIVRGQPRTDAGGAPGSLVITQSGFANIQGDAANPVVFTTAAIGDKTTGLPDIVNGVGFEGELVRYDSGIHTAADFYDNDPIGSPLPPQASGSIPGQQDNAAHDEMWGGLVILGSAPTNVGTSGNPLIWADFIEGLVASADSQYGGPFINDNSGIYRYISVRHGGDEIGSANEINGVTMGGVGQGTIMEFIEVYCNYDDGFEWFGGTVNGKYLTTLYAGDDQFDGDQGWTGKVQFTFAVLPYFPIGSADGDKGMEFDGDDSDRYTPSPAIQVSTQTPTPYIFQDYWFYNSTVIGNSLVAGKTVADNGSINPKSNFAGTIAASIICNTGSSAGIIEATPNDYNILNVTFSGCAANSQSAPFNNSGVFSFAAKAPYPGLAGEDITYGSGTLDPRPGNLPFAQNIGLAEVGGIESVSYRGAFSPTEPLWIAGWTVASISGTSVE